MTAKKFDSGKAPISLIPREALEQEAMVLLYGANKYGKYNWKQGMEYSRFIDASLRHIIAFASGENLDPESGLSHLAAARCSLGFLIHYIENQLGTDDRDIK